MDHICTLFDSLHACMQPINAGHGVQLMHHVLFHCMQPSSLDACLIRVSIQDSTWWIYIEGSLALIEPLSQTEVSGRLKQLFLFIVSTGSSVSPAILYLCSLSKLKGYISPWLLAR